MEPVILLAIGSMLFLLGFVLGWTLGRGFGHRQGLKNYMKLESELRSTTNARIHQGGEDSLE